ncbi:GNAT family N-acetyltransferase [Sediminibacillus dalangtanensis]|uniref:GNAT family N-acetyltransferase n=1 Tax=Sediminibacillus dalangtanensis TaxID=2729421 RepID=A0ABX7VX26_9BACI|nr:GNAT family protein [Sediminibacillus dalangtanensis]QTN01400.1 GNAT family N-acetyltransferase [Sediminibacillus dalangtanensis]
MLEGKDIYLRPFEKGDAAQTLQLQKRNKEFFERFSMTRSEAYYTLSTQQKLMESFRAKREADEAYHFGIYQKSDHQLVGNIQLLQVVRGSLQSSFIGYFVDESHNGKGYASEAVKQITSYAFNGLKLHRIEAGVMPHNKGSIRVLEKAGFHREGIARKNVFINGKWEDHQVLALLNPADSVS